ncbi:MAG: hypothetical protein PW734_01325 [Verrucomicrobium sp.]|nr:hypothetical protein [Verrucomicrobium sp.]
MQILQPGQKVYITKINEDIQGKEDSLKVTILTTDAVVATYTNGTYGGRYQTAKRYSTTLAFKEPKGTLSKMSEKEASEMIGAILSFNPADQGRGRAAGVVARSCEPNCAVSATTGETIGSAQAAAIRTSDRCSGADDSSGYGEHTREHPSRLWILVQKSIPIPTWYSSSTARLAM